MDLAIQADGVPSAFVFCFALAVPCSVVLAVAVVFAVLALFPAFCLWLCRVPFLVALRACRAFLARCVCLVCLACGVRCGRVLFAVVLAALLVLLLGCVIGGRTG